MPEDTLSVYARSQPGKPGVIDDRPDGTVIRWTYAELEAQSNRVANLLLSLGAGPGTKVLWCGPNSPDVVAVMSATRKIGAVAVPLNYRLTPSEALYVVNHSDAEIVYVDYEYAPMFAALRFTLEKGRSIPSPQYRTPAPLTPRVDSAPFYATTGVGGDLYAGAQDAVRAMVDHISRTYALAREDAYVLCSLVVDLKISEIVDAGEYIVSAFLPEAVFL